MVMLRPPRAVSVEEVVRIQRWGGFVGILWWGCIVLLHLLQAKFTSRNKMVGATPHDFATEPRFRLMCNCILLHCCIFAMGKAGFC